MKLDIAVLKPGDEITYKGCGHVGVNQRVIRTGVVMSVSSGRKICVVIDLGKYRDTIYEHDLMSGDIQILEVKKGEEEMKKSTRPDKEYLQTLFEKANGSIKRTAAMCEPQVSDVTMGKWLRDLGIIPQLSERSTTPAPAADELRTAWDEAGHVMARLAKKYGVSPGLAKRWLKMMGIVKETATGLETIPDPESSNTAPTDHSQNELNKQSPAPVMPAEEQENETLKKIIKFYLAPVEARLKNIEEAVDTLGAKAIKEYSVTTDITLSSDELLNTVADLILRTAAKMRAQ